MFPSQSFSSFQTTPRCGTGPNPKPLCAPSFSLSLSVHPSSLFLGGPLLVMFLFLHFQFYNVLLPPPTLLRTFVAIFINHTASFDYLISTTCFCRRPQSAFIRPWQYSSTGARLAVTTQPSQPQNLQKPRRSGCLFSPIIYEKTQRGSRVEAVSTSTSAIKEHMRKPCGATKVSMLWSPIDTRLYPYTSCLPLPVVCH